MRRRHSCPTMLAPKYGRGSSAVVAAARSIALLSSTLIGSIDRLARLKSIARNSELDLVVELVGGHQRAARCSIGLARNRARARLAGGTPVAGVACALRLAAQPPALEQKLDEVLARPFCEQLRPVELGTGIRQVRQDCRHRARVPWLRGERDHADGLLNIELLARRLLCAHADPAEQDRGNDPSPLGVAQPSDRRGRSNRTKHDLPRGRDSGSGRIPLPLILKRGERDLSVAADLPAHDAPPGREMGGADSGAGEELAALPPPLKGGGCSRGRQSFLSFVITVVTTFLSP